MGINNPASGGGSSLTGWETDADGNLVNTGGGDIVPNSVTEPIVVRSKFKSGGPANQGEGVCFRIVSDNADGDTSPSDQPVFEVDEYNGWVIVRNFQLNVTDADGDAKWFMRNMPGEANDFFFSTEAYNAGGPGAGTAVILQTGTSGAGFSAWLQVDPDGGLRLGDAARELAFYGGSPVAQPVIAAAAADAGTTQTLANSIRTILLANGLVKAA